MIPCPAVHSWQFSVFLSYHQANLFRVCHRPTNCFLCLIWQIGNIVRRAGLSKLVHGGRKKKEVNQKLFCFHTAVDAECIWLSVTKEEIKRSALAGRDIWRAALPYWTPPAKRYLGREESISYLTRVIWGFVSDLNDVRTSWVIHHMKWRFHLLFAWSVDLTSL